ncbi:RagB/SusD family nutrient uptake outer membrane protein [Pseudobacter ginsenosidimutans]|uniref:Putative outer membrane starch-binding protein n=1 Tax=Pseudobacter ginsenosidimutans TaxID=661488 RepID=A0A4Q7MVM8_9BACT|nr:RagB/SusD family nutrient uptake outer membrane protein [Pseudobacter ginsenosidimutans]QEC40605.1 RagB/SusD family nutrient uptake outer membrane protein [Pseudobacter ginsenosidimutans]RZS72678.1 putative outer membrane starch-binding protein [Pseudobacter ginsenosidimutans]
MKTIKILLLLGLLATSTVSCKKTFLDETAVDFLSTSNAFKTEADFKASISNMYGRIRAHYYTVNDYMPFWYMYRTDAYLDVQSSAPNLPGQIAPTAGEVTFAWGAHYKFISEANTIIGRLPASTLTDEQKLLFEARARFFRAFGYRALAYLYANVPLVLEEIQSPKTDFTQSTREQVYEQIILDLEFAAANLPTIDKVNDGEISNLVAYHLLAEVCNSAKQYEKAKNAATAVISDPNMALMTARFGSRKDGIPANGIYPAIAGDVYWDLFQPRNQNRKTGGNKEALWVIQFETDIPGGGNSTTKSIFEGEAFYALERVHTPLMRDIKVNGVSVFQWPVSDFTGGRGVGFMAPDPWFADTVWKNSGADMRNANHNFVREFIGTNPASPLYGQVFSTKNLPPGATGFNNAVLKPGVAERALYPYQSKATTPFAHPASLLNNPASSDVVGKLVLKGGAGGTYLDQYMFRLAETYLLRAEAQLGLNRPDLAANDINVVRSRSNAGSVDAADVNIDYILDERLRELGVEEKRMLTLMRLGKWADRMRKCNPFYAAQVQDHYNLWPIPAGEIERNNMNKLNQNPGYPQ